MNAPEMAKAEKSETEWESRALCPDDSCIGVLGADGRCRVCGQRGEVPTGAALDAGPPGGADVDDDPDDDHADDLNDDQRAAAADSTDDEAGADLVDRELCPDDGCIGLLDDSGKCKVCGAQKSP